MNRSKAEKVARALDRAWAIQYARARGSRSEAETFISWLERFRVTPTVESNRSPEEAAQEGTPVAVSACEEMAAMRWFADGDCLVGRDGDLRLYRIPKSELGNMPDVSVADDRDEAPPTRACYVFF